VVTLDEKKLAGSLAPGSVHVWCVTAEGIDDAEVLRQGTFGLTALEVARATRFVKPEDRHRFIIGRWMLCHLLGAYTLSDPHEITLVINQNGRPELLGFNQSGIRFSLSTLMAWSRVRLRPASR
jgi:hypothetical protein